MADCDVPDQDLKTNMMDDSPQKLERELDRIIEACTECGNCVRQCQYLRQYGTPRALAEAFKAGILAVETIYSCNLCRLCNVVCPERLEPSGLFHLMRCSMVADGRAPLRQHRRMLTYERIGLSRIYELYVIPENCTAVFFPGCALAGSRPEQTLRLFSMMRTDIPDLGVVLSCCAKPSRDLGRTGFFNTVIDRLLDRLKHRGVHSIITACPSCQSVLSEHGSGFDVKTIYHVLAGGTPAAEPAAPAAVAIHDPCATRFDTDLHKITRSIVSAAGLDIKEMKYKGKRTLCCGEGGSACYVDAAITDSWAEKRAEEAAGLPVLTYCAGCVEFFSKRFETIHIIDLLLHPQRAMTGAAKISKSPMTYVNRLMVKLKMKRLAG